ncbi:MAG: InlB B-repeat-containing protein [Lachnospiraceae bacterium]|nr:InlB B-repeat-containing protein [Lachnospiraceae bacterium]
MKHKRFKRCISVLLVLAMCVSYLPSTAYAVEDETNQAQTEETNQSAEDSSNQLGEYTSPTEPQDTSGTSTEITEADETEESEPLASEAEITETEFSEPETFETEDAETQSSRGIDVPKLRGAGAPSEGRANAGDVAINAGGTTYILIGTKQQLKALDYYPNFISAGSLGENSDALTEAQRYDVTGPIWCLEQTRSNNTSPWVTTTATLVYPGDADLIDGIDVGGTPTDFSGYALYGENDCIPGPNTSVHTGRKIGTQYDYEGHIGADTRTFYVGGTLDAPDESITSYNYGKYSPRGNYVVFRDINLNNEAWTPLMFYGRMLGIKGEALSESSLSEPTLVNAVNAILSSRRSADYANTIAKGGMNIKQPTISNISVSTTGELYTTKYIGVGFFASVTSNRPGSDFSFTPVRAEVRNLKLDNVSVNNGFTGIHVEQTLVNLLTDGLGILVGRLLDMLLPMLLSASNTEYTNFTQSLSDLLAARQRDITNLATGGFTGRIDGDVLIENCDVDTVTVTSRYGYTGGFVGYSTGCEQYLPVTGPLLSILKALLNLIPGLGLGDLITIVSQVLHVNYLIPMDYLNPVINDSDVRHLGGNIGPAQSNLANADWSYTLNAGSATADQGDVRFNGGFVGCKIATQMVNCSISDSDYTVWAKTYGGGFAGCARDAVIQELLTGLGVDLIKNANANLESVQVRCSINNSDVTVKGENYLGGFNGAMANAYCVNSEVNCPGKSLKVIGTGDGVGGFAGVATLGWAMNLGNEDAPGNEDLLSTVKHLLGTILGGRFNDSLLDLLGVGKSYILGLQFDWSKADGSGEEVEVTGANCVGGLVGQADALVMTGTTTDMLEEISYFEHGDLGAWDVFPDMPVKTTFTVTYRLMTGASMSGSTTTTVGPNSYELVLPSANAPSGYVFEGWVTGNYDHTDVKPEKIYTAGSTIIVTRDITLKALFSKAGAEAYELVLEEPDSARDWGGDYVITHNIAGNDVKVLTGLANNQYYAANSAGATALSENGVHIHEKYKNYLVGVTNSLVFTATKADLIGTDYYFQNKATGSYLSVEAYDNDPSLFGTDYVGRLYAGAFNIIESQWSLGIRTTLPEGDTVGDVYALLLQSDTLNVKDYYLGFNNSGCFEAAKTGSTNPSLRNIYLWRKSNLPTTYTTVAEGQELTADDMNVSDIEAYVGVFKHVNAKGLKEINGVKYVGGLVGLADTASVTSLLGDTVGLGKFEKFDFSEIYAVGSLTDGLTVTGTDYYVGGGIGLALGGNIHPLDENGYGIKLDELKAVTGMNCAGGFAGCVGPGELLGTGGLNVQLLGLSILKANNLLSLGKGLETTLDSVTVTGVTAGYTVEASGSVAQNGLATYAAGGFFGRSNSTVANDCHAVNVQWVKANDTDGRAGGFIGVSEVGGLASMDSAEGTEIKSLIQADGLLDAIGYLIPEYTLVDTTYVNGGFVQAACAGGFAADFQSGTVDNSAKNNDDWYAVYNIDHVTGSLYGGGFGGRLFSGALADAGGGISILGDIDGLNINVQDLIDLVKAYVPKIIKAGVNSTSRGASGTEQPGFIVTVTGAGEDKTSGAAGGFVGYASGAQISYCDVKQLRHTNVVPPAQLDGKAGDSYYDGSSAYAVTGTRYSGGYAGCLDIGSSASLGGGLKVLGDSISAKNVLDALNVVISTVEHSDVYGGAGGFAVKASWLPAASDTDGDDSDTDGDDSDADGDAEVPAYEGRAGGFAGWMRGAHIQDSHSWNFSYIIGQIAAGGYVGEMEPGSVADAIGDTSVLDGLANVSGSLLSIAKDFVPTIRNSVTTCIPCGGAVRANAFSDSEVQRGMAGGYAGHNLGGQIWGNNDDPWKDEYEPTDNDKRYNGPQSECAAIRILSVYGAEYAGGFTGLMEAGSTADTGNISLLYDLVKLNGLLDALKISYPTEENTAVYGPLYGVSKDSWNAWVDYVGQYGGYGLGMERIDENTTDAQFADILAKYLYGYHVTAGRDEFNNDAMTVYAGCAGGYVGAMRSGTITNGQAYNCKQVKAMRNAGGFAGEMKTGSVANLGQASALGLNLDLEQLLKSALGVFVPVVKTSSVHGYQNGMTVVAFGDSIDGCGNAGGYAGTARGAQIWGDDTGSDNPLDGCNVFNLKKVQGTRYVGGYIGNLSSGSTAEAGTNISEGPLQDLLDLVVKSGTDNASSLLSLVNATVSTVRKAKVTVADTEWGFTVGGLDGNVPLCAGGFAGAMEGAIVGNNKNKTMTETNIEIENLRGVQARYYAGGFVGVANVGGAASVAGNGANVLTLLKLNQVSALDIFRPYIFNSKVTGVSEGFTVLSTEETESGIMCSTRYSGCSGGFAGALLDGSIKNSQVINLSDVKAPNYAGGFVGHSGKSGLADVDGAKLTDLLGLNAGVADAFGSHIKSSSVSGVEHGYTVYAVGGQEPVAGGFAGYADLAKIGVKTPVIDSEPEAALACSASGLKFVSSEQIAGGFVGKTTKGYLLELQASSPILNDLLAVVDILVQALRLPEAERMNLINISLGALGYSEADILGLDVLSEGNLIAISLLGIRITVSLGIGEGPDGVDVAKVTIGDSYIELPCNSDGTLNRSNATVRLIPLFYTTINNSNVSAADTQKGYDVFGGGASQDADGTHVNGYAGGFAGFNNLGEITNCETVNCDVVRGTPANVGGNIQKVGPFTGCYYDDSIYNANSQTSKETNDKFNGTAHRQEMPGSAPFETDAKVKLMEDDVLPPNSQTLVTETAEMQNPCEPYAELTLHKVWDDMDGTLGLRASGENVSVTFTIWQAADGGTPTQYDTVTLTAADANPFTENVWTKKLTVPATETISGVLTHYSYYVTEAVPSGYITGTAYADADVADKLNFFTDKDGGYVAKLTNQAAMEQTIVVDFGLPVSISVIDYLKTKYEFALSEMEVEGILPLNDLQKVSRYDTKDNEDNEVPVAALDVQNIEGVPTPVAPVSGVQPQYGSFSVPEKVEDEAVSRLRYIPGSMMFDKPVNVAVALKSAEGVHYYTKVTVVPATMIYYEDDFIEFSSEWVNAGTSQYGEQDEDRPGADELDMNNIYGYDSRYANGTTYSLESSKMVTVLSGMSPTASFTFTGTGFDVLAVTDRSTGFMTVELYNGKAATAQNRIASWAVDTFYGCTRSENGYIRYLCVWDENAGDNGLWRVAKTECPEMTDAAAAAKVGTTEDGCVVKADYPTDISTNHTSFIVYKKNYVWTADGAGNTLYQVPAITSRDANVSIPYGTYTVVIKPKYSTFFDHVKINGSYKLYIDGVRIYGPAEGLDEEYYLKDHEGWPQFIEMRKLLISQGSFGQEQQDEDKGIVYIDGGITITELSEFEQYGPNNEIYLDPGQAVGFRLKKGESAKIDQIHVSMKRIFDDEAKVTFTCGTEQEHKSTELTLNTASECYYNLSDIIQWAPDSSQTDLIVISNTGESGTISLRNLKITYKEAVANEADLVHVVKGSPDQAMMTLRLVRSLSALPIILDENPAFAGASISLENDFSLHFYIPAQFLADKTNPYVVFTKHTDDGSVDICQYDYVEKSIGGTLYRRYSFRNIAAAEMGTEITARLFYNADGIDHMSHVFSYSIRQYAMDMLARTNDAELKTLLVNMLNYGTEAQKYFGVSTNSPVNAGLTEEQKKFATAQEPELENHKSIIPLEGATAGFEGYSLSLKRNVTLNYYIDLSASGLSAEEAALELSWQDADGTEKTSVIDGSAFAAKRYGNKILYVAILDELKSVQMRTVVSATVVRKADQAPISDTLCYSIESYAQSQMENNSALSALICEMMKYGDAAEVYFSNR